MNLYRTYKALTCALFPLLSLFSPIASEEWQRIYLATPPRSGNHWIRYLVEEASGIATGAVYRDREPMHMDRVFSWGGFCAPKGYEGNRRYPQQGEIVLIKTHFPDAKKTPFDEKSYNLAIRIVRHPVDSFYSRYVKNPGEKLKDKVPSDKLRDYAFKWKRFLNYWNKQKKVLTFRYEDLLENPLPALKTICEALHYDVSEEDLQRAIAKYPPEGHMLKHLDKFHQRDLEWMAEELKEELAQFDYEIPLF